MCVSMAFAMQVLLNVTEIVLIDEINICYNVLNLFAEARAAASALNGRYFGGRTVRAQLYDQDLFDHEDLSG